MELKDLSKKRQEMRQHYDIYRTQENNKPKYYILDMFPYPSGAGLHVGHPKWYVASDCLARKKMLEGFNVLHPMWFDTFGLGTEQYAIDHKMKPQDVAHTNITTYIKQLENLWLTYDRSRSFSTADPDYYKWTQTIFLKFFTHYYDEATQKAQPISQLEAKLKAEGKDQNEINKIIDNERLAYIDYKPINRCPKCKTGLANEDLDDGRCERCGSEIEQKPMRQWVLRITKYADRLISGLDTVNRDESIKDLERNWIGKSEGTQFDMVIASEKKQSWNEDLKFSVYTTRVDTVFGMSFVVIAPEHPLLKKIENWKLKIENWNEIHTYQEQANKKTQLERTELQKDKTGIEIKGIKAINPFNGQSVSIFVADYVLANYGTGVVMAVPAHDERDFEFAKKYTIPIIQSVAPVEQNHPDFDAIATCEVCYPNKGILVNSGEFTGLTSDEAIVKMQVRLTEKSMWEKKCNYKIQDWVFSRQRYRGEPFPVVFCDDCGVVPMNESDLPLLLPDVDNYEPTGTEEWPLADIEDWINTPCPHCGKLAHRESNTMPGWAWSSRYWLRYMDPKNPSQLISPEKEKYRGAVDTYVWGAEHVTRHMIYARFWQKFLFDIGIVTQDEPFLNYRKVWLIMAEDWRKMSKRWGNVINPDDIINEFWADALRIYEMFMGPFDQAIAWSTNGIKWVKKFLDKIIALQNKLSSFVKDGESEGQKDLEWNETKILLNQTIKKLTEDIDGFRFNTAISQLMIFVNHLTECSTITKKTFEDLVILISPFAPHLAEELREQLGNEFSLFTKATWPKYNELYLVADTITIAVQVNGKVRWTLHINKEAEEQEVIQLAKSDEKIATRIVSEPQKVIYIKGKILNIVV